MGNRENRFEIEKLEERIAPAAILTVTPPAETALPNVLPFGGTQIDNGALNAEIFEGGVEESAARIDVL